MIKFKNINRIENRPKPTHERDPEYEAMMKGVIEKAAKAAIEQNAKYPLIDALGLRQGTKDNHKGKDYWMEDKGNNTGAGGTGGDTSSAAITLHFSMKRLDPRIHAAIMNAQGITNKDKLQKETMEITSDEHRSQDQNRAKVKTRLHERLQRALDPKGEVEKAMAKARSKREQEKAEAKEKRERAKAAAKAEKARRKQAHAKRKNRDSNIQHQQKKNRRRESKNISV